MLKKMKIKKGRLNNERGGVLLISYFVIVVILGLGAAFVALSTNEARVSERQRLSTIAFHIAEAGIERGIYEVTQDLLNDSTPSWDDGDIHGMNIGPDTNNFYTIPFADTSLNGGSYTVELLNVGSEGTDVYIRSYGTYSGVTTGILTYVKMIDVSPWANAIFAGAGAAGAMVNGNVDIRGSVHILGTGLATGDLAIDLGGTAELVGNNYSTIDPALAAKVPLLDTIVYNGELVETLGAELRVKNGVIGLSGSSTVGEADVAGNAYKETIDGAYVSDGYGGNMGAVNVHSDNGTTNGYDLGDIVSFPSLSDPDPDEPSKTVQQAFRDNALILTNELSSITPSSSFSYSDGTNTISMDGSGNLTITGRVYIDGNNNFTTGKSGPNDTITYTGNGSLLVTGNVDLQTDLITAGNNSFPNNIMGIMTPNNISMTAANIDVMGVFYAETQVTVTKQTDIMGTIVSNYFDMGTNVPAIYQVPETVNYLPPGMIASTAYWYKVVSWQKI